MAADKKMATARNPLSSTQICTAGISKIRVVSP